MPCCLPFGKAGGLQIQRCQGLAVDDYSFTLGALALEPSDFCNTRVYPDDNKPVDTEKKEKFMRRNEYAIGKMFDIRLSDPRRL